ncbi:hypothetical protein [uncultured Bosea sp.]|uniref:hypothetical protein n=1 Tax=uncultured Bosea sp. TaxID=211457 RepID=UPI0025ECDD5C|nr:hypothetical protein [uncultured Bosea sp.]
MMLKVWPQLAGYKVKHCWGGEVGTAADKIAHMGKRGGVDFAISCNGSSVALMTCLGHQSALRHEIPGRGRNLDSKDALPADW